jgi:hypothetical protein
MAADALPRVEPALERAAQVLARHPHVVSGTARLDVNDANLGTPIAVAPRVRLRLVERPEPHLQPQGSHSCPHPNALSAEETSPDRSCGGWSRFAIRTIEGVSPMESTDEQDHGGSDQPADAMPATSEAEPVLRIEFYGNAGPRGVTPESRTPGTTDRPPSPPARENALAPAAAPPAPHAESAHDELADQRQRTLEKLLAEREGMIAAQEAEAAEREAALARREQSLAGSEGLFEAESADLERRERRLAQMESTLQGRTQELDERELEVERRESELEAAFSMREDRIEQREAELAELQGRLERKEQDLARYVGQIQAEFARRT